MSERERRKDEGTKKHLTITITIRWWRWRWMAVSEDGIIKGKRIPVNHLSVRIPFVFSASLLPWLVVSAFHSRSFNCKRTRLTIPKFLFLSSSVCDRSSMIRKHDILTFHMFDNEPTMKISSNKMNCGRQTIIVRPYSFAKSFTVFPLLFLPVFLPLLLSSFPIASFFF